MSKVEMFLVERPVVISRTASHIKKVNKLAKRYCLKRMPYTAWNPTKAQKEQRNKLAEAARENKGKKYVEFIEAVRKAIKKE